MYVDYMCIYIYICNILISSHNFMLHFFAPRFPSGRPWTTSVARESAGQISPGFDGTLWGWERPKTQGLGLGLVNGCVPNWAQKHPVVFFQNYFGGNQHGYMIYYIYIWLSLAIWIFSETHNFVPCCLLFFVGWFLKINPYFKLSGWKAPPGWRSRHRRCCGIDTLWAEIVHLLKGETIAAKRFHGVYS